MIDYVFELDCVSPSTEKTDVNRSRYVVVTENTQGQPSADGIFPFQFIEETHYSRLVKSNGDGTFEINTGFYPIRVIANTITVGNLNDTRVSYIKETGQPAGTRLSGSTDGVFGMGSDQKPAVATIPANTSITIEARSVSSGGTQRLDVGASIEFIELIDDSQNLPNIVSGLTGIHRVSKDEQVVNVLGAATSIVTNHDLSTYTDDAYLRIYFRDRVSDRPWQFEDVDVKALLDKYNGAADVVDTYISVYADDHVRLDLKDPAIGEVEFFEVGRDFEYYKSELFVVAQTVSRRVGMIERGPSGRTPSEGYLAMSGVVANGAIDYPIAALRNPQIVSGNDFDFTKYAGAYDRNLLGNAGAEGVLVQDKTAVNGLTGTTRFNRSENTTSNGGAFRLTGTGSEITANVNFSGDNETAPVTVASQWYLIVDTYTEGAASANGGATSDSLNYRGIYGGGNDYKEHDLVHSGGRLHRALADFTSAGGFSSADWETFDEQNSGQIFTRTGNFSASILDKRTFTGYNFTGAGGTATIGTDTIDAGDGNAETMLIMHNGTGTLSLAQGTGMTYTGPASIETGEAVYITYLNGTTTVGHKIGGSATTTQMGNVPVGNGSGSGTDVKTTAFPTAFTNVPIVNATGVNTTGNGQGAVITILSTSTSGFDWIAHRNDGIPFSNFAGLNWIAVSQ